MKDFEKSSKEALCDLLRKVPIIEIKSLEAEIGRAHV